MSDSLGVVVLAAGQGTRMKSRTHKVLHPIAGLPMIDHVLRTAQALSPKRVMLVIGHGAEQVQAHLGDSVAYALQDPLQGTGDAVRVTRAHLQGAVDTVLVLMGDSPLLRVETIQQLLRVHREQRPLLTMLYGHTHDPGRVVRDSAGRVLGIVEEKAATPEQLLIAERNSGVYAFQAEWLWNALADLQRSPAGEYYLTDLVGGAVAAGEHEGRWPVAAVEISNPSEAMGVNNRVQLAEAEAIVQRELLERLMLSGVTVTDPATTFVHVGVEVAQDTVLLPGTHLLGKTTIGAGCTIGPAAYIVDSTIGDGCRITYSTIEGSRMESGSDLGPYSHLRPGTRVGANVHLGNFVELKNTRMGDDSRSAHVSVLLDADIGEDTNIGAGTITANYDGTNKHRTTIGNGVFIGVDTLLRAPVEVGDGARTGAGAVVLRDVPPGRTAVGVPARLAPRREVAQPDGVEEGAPDGR